MPLDPHVRRTGDDYAEVMAGDLPTGPAWTRDPDSTLMQVVSGLAQVWGDVDGRFADLLEIESDPRSTYEMLPDWERAFGLPDPCIPVVQTLAERRVALVVKMTMQGGQSRAFFIGVAASLGYRITIREYRPFQFGLSSFGGSRGQFQPPSVRFYWRVRVSGGRSTRFSFGGSSFGRDSFLEIRKAEDLECMFRRWKPAHTIVLFDYHDFDPDPAVDRFEFGMSSFGNDPFTHVVST
jgi:uncharacterized protein YmfQ (DUF2313 family)